MRLISAGTWCEYRMGEGARCGYDKVIVSDVEGILCSNRFLRVLTRAVFNVPSRDLATGKKQIGSTRGRATQGR